MIINFNITHIMKEKEQMFDFLNMLRNVLKDVEEDAHFFDDNSDRYKKCKDFNICAKFSSITDSIAKSTYTDEIIEDLFAFAAFMKVEYMFATDVNIDDILKRKDDILKRKDVNLLDFYLRFENVVKDFKNYDKLVAILNEEQLSVLRKIVLDVNKKIEDLFNKIMDRNRAESVILISKLQKAQQEEKSYEDMTKEELIALLNNK